MLIALLAIIVLFAGAVIVYAQRELAHRCPGVGGCRLARVVLALAGTAVGWAALSINGQYPALIAPFTPAEFGAAAASLNLAVRVLTFVVGFALVHVPAAAILFLKKQGPFVDHRDPLE